MIVCVLVPRFGLIAALGERGTLLREPAALAPEPGREQLVGEVSAAAEACGVRPGLRLGEALARCPELRLVPPDPERAREVWNEVLDRLEWMGAEVESDRHGEAYFSAAGLLGIHGGTLEGVLAATRRRIGRGAQIGAAPSRFCARAAALRTRPRRRAEVVPGRRARAYLAPLPVGLLRSRHELAGLPETLERLGIRTLGELAELPRPAVAERFGHPGLLALDLACGRDTPLEPRRPFEPVVERLALPEAAAGPQLERGLELLIARLLARPERRGRTLRAATISALLSGGGTWRVAATLRRPSADPELLALALANHLGALPGPAAELRLEVEAFGPPAREQVTLREEHDARRARLGEAVRQARQAAGDGAALRVLEVDPDSRVPERRAVLAPYPAEGDKP